MHQAKIDEAASFKRKAKEIAAQYCRCLQSIGCDAELSAEYGAKTFLGWVSDEVSALEDHMTPRQDFATVTAFKAVCTGLFDAGCDHLEAWSILT